MAHTTFPSNLPVPTDDGACDHLLGSHLPKLALRSTAGGTVSLTDLSDLTIIFIYPRTGAPNETIPASWDAIPGARGCTPQAICFRDSYASLKSHGVTAVFGLSTQPTAYQQEIKNRVNIPYELLSDEHLEFATAMKLPLFDWEDTKLIKRMVLAIVKSEIVKVWYPVFPPDASASLVLEWLKEKK